MLAFTIFSPYAQIKQLAMDEGGPAPAEQQRQAQILQVLKIPDREALQLGATGVPCLLAGYSRPLLFRTVGGFPSWSCRRVFLQIQAGTYLLSRASNELVYIC